MISSDDQLISFQKGKETRSPLKYPQGISTDGSICECEEKYLLFFFFKNIAFLISENLLLLMENKEEKFQLVHGGIRCWL